MTGDKYIHWEDRGAFEEPSNKSKCLPTTCPNCQCEVGEEE